MQADDRAAKAMPSAPGSRPEGADLTGESVAGEEDPGACNDLAAAAPAVPEAQEAPQAPGVPDMAPGDEAPPGTPGTGEDVCPRCGGSGRSDGAACPACEGSGRIVKGIGGA